MRKYVLSIVLLLVAATVFGQKKSIVNLIQSKSSTGVKINGKDLIKVYQGTFRQDFSTLTSDSAYFYPQDNAFDAFGHVNINQGDTLNIYSDKLNYNGNTKVALLNDNVRMVDKDATLTTNHFTYNTATRIGTYTDGGKLVNKDNTLLSKNGYYFAKSRDAYFRYNVSLKTSDALVKTDTMRYNTGTKIAYFYGPTDIYSTKNEKDKDTLYTENGNYDTGLEQARFGKKNLYRSGTKSLKGDSLFYDKIKGFGKAIGHVTFTDKEQKTTIKGNLGTYFKADERTVVTQDPYVVLITEEKDSTKTDSAAKADSLLKNQPPRNGKKTINMQQVIKNTIPVDMDKLSAQQKKQVAKGDSVLRTLPPPHPNTIAKADSIIKTLPSDTPLKADSVLKTLPIPDDLKKKADLLLKANSPPAKAKTKPVPAKKPATPPKAKPAGKASDEPKTTAKLAAIKDTSHIKRDSIYISADTLETVMMTYKDYKIFLEKERLSRMRDTTAKPKKKEKEKPTKFLVGHFKGVSLEDTSYRRRDYFGKPKPVVKKVPKPLTKKQLQQDSIKQKFLADSVAEVRKHEPADTARIRILIAHHHAKLFKSDMQAKADSMFYSGSDSTLRCYVNPMIWAEGSQLSGDTINLQMKHKKLDNMQMFLSSFIVNIDKKDSTHFNQVGGKRMRGYFKDDKLSLMWIEGNAESIYFSRDSAKNEVDGMQRSISSKIRTDFKDNKVTHLSFYTKPQNVYTPIAKVKEDDKILKGFIWKPQDRPISKEAILPSYNRKKEAAAQKVADKTKGAKPPAGKKLPDGKTLKDTSKTPALTPGIKAGKDSTLIITPVKPGVKSAADTTSKGLPAKQPHPFIKSAKDSTAKDTSTKKPAVIKKPVASGN